MEYLDRVALYLHEIPPGSKIIFDRLKDSKSFIDAVHKLAAEGVIDNMSWTIGEGYLRKHSNYDYEKNKYYETKKRV
jgi:hypothetical protein